MSRISFIALFMLLVCCGPVFSQTATVNDTASSWYVGLDALKLVQSLRNKAWSPGIEGQSILSLEMKAFQERGNNFRPAFRLGYRAYDFTTLEKDVSSRGVYGKAGIEWVFDRSELTNQVLGLHGLMSRIREDNSMQVGNEYFGYTRRAYEYRVWLPAVELNYAYTAQVMPRLGVQLEAFVSFYERNNRYRQLGQLPGVAKLIDGSVHFFYQVY